MAFIEEYGATHPDPNLLTTSQFNQLEQLALLRRKWRQEDIAAGIALAFKSN